VYRRAAALTAVAAAAAVASAGCGSGKPAEWSRPNADTASTRSIGGGGITGKTVSQLRVAWRFRLRSGRHDPSGAVTATPVVAGGTVFVQDMRSNVYALDLRDGRLLWQRRFGYPNPGPNGLAVADGLVYGATDTTVFALSAHDGSTRWLRRLVTPVEPYVDVAPQVADGLVHVSTVGYPPGGRGAVYALDAATGAVRWKRSTIRGPWRYPHEAGGGGAWQTPSVADGLVYWGTANPGPWGGTPRRPNGGSFPGPALYTDSLLVLATGSGALRWYDQVTPHDIRDHDFQLPPILATVAGHALVLSSGKAGIAIAWDRRTHRRVWQTEVGVHRNDRGPLPPRFVEVCPGLLGGVETPMAYADGRLFVPVVDLCVRGSARGYQSLASVDVTRGSGELVALDAATGRRLWRRRLSQPTFGCATVAADVVFTTTFDGHVHAFGAADGAPLWSARLRAGSNACPAVAGDTLLVPAGVPLGPGAVPELVAFRR
jgi:alcohol dehydrogenase (cytochrome c)